MGKYIWENMGQQKPVINPLPTKVSTLQKYNPPLYESISYNWSLLYSLDPFVPNAPFLYPLKTSENRKVFWCFQGVEKVCIGNKWVKESGNQKFSDVFREYKKRPVASNGLMQWKTWNTSKHWNKGIKYRYKRG